MTPLRKHREELKLTSRKVALDLDIDPSHYRRVEIGETPASAEVADKISKYFHGVVTRDQILFPQYYPDRTRKPAHHAEQFAEAS
jgi:transcriptional regulator with XRE-family HTH domain